MLFIIVAIAVLIVVGVSGGVLPTRISMSRRGDYFIKMGNIFSGGVFLGGGLMHLIPEASELFEEADPSLQYPFAFLAVAIGFALVLLIEKVIMRGEDVGRLSRALTAQDLATIVAEIDSGGGGGGDRHSHSFAPATELKGVQRTYPFILTLVLSTHSLIAGAALGLEEQAATSVAILVAILAHKFFAAFALGISLKEAAFSYQYLTSVVIFFSLMTPLGIIIGRIFSSALASDTSLWFQAIFSALAGGTFLYVAVIEIIDEAFEKGGQYRQQFMFMSLGFALMALLGIWG